MAAWAVESLDDGEGIPIADETGDAKSSADAVGAGNQYSGSRGGCRVCQVAVHLSFASSLGHTVLDRALYLPWGWATGEVSLAPQATAWCSGWALAFLSPRPGHAGRARPLSWRPCSRRKRRRGARWRRAGAVRCV
ncbi:transposase [Streptomyces sp. NPDC057910]|uniref:transposase n=1 Tax=Streptomyces sp. NPDC057910 TaxID=3346278 RepID=UPI0036E03BEC